MTNEPAPTPPTVTRTDRIDLRPLLHGLWRRAWVIAICAGIAGLAALAYSLTQEKEYEATASILFRDPGLAQGLVGPALPRYPAEVVQDVATNTALVELDEVGDRTAAELGSLDSDQVNEQVDVDQSGLSGIYEVTARDDDAEVVAPVANTYARTGIAIKREIDRRMVTQALQRIESDVDELRARIAADPDGASTQEEDRLKSLSDGIRGLTIFRSLQSGNVRLIEPAEQPTSASSPKPLLDTAYGVVLGGVLGLALALLLMRIDRRVEDEPTAEKAYGRPVTAVDPTDTEIKEMLSQLRYARAARGLHFLGVTSAADDEGRAELSRRIAAVAASSGASTLLVADGGDGGSQADGFDVRGYENAGEGSPSFLDGESAHAALQKLKAEYEFIVVDAAAGVDAAPLLSAVDATVLVGRLGQTLKPQAQELSRRLGDMEPPVLGLLLTSR